MATYNRAGLELNCESIADLLQFIEQSPQDASPDMGRYRFVVMIDGQRKGSIYTNSGWRPGRFIPTLQTLQIKADVVAIPDPHFAWNVNLNGITQWTDEGYLVNEARLGMPVEDFGRLVYHHDLGYRPGHDREMEQWFARRLAKLNGWEPPVPLVPFDPEPYLHQLLPMHHAKFLLRRIKATPQPKERENEV
jgi:hypothetical protein